VTFAATYSREADARAIADHFAKASRAAPLGDSSPTRGTGSEPSTLTFGHNRGCLAERTALLVVRLAVPMSRMRSDGKCGLVIAALLRAGLRCESERKD
jgi:hypothetical protein